MTEKEWTRIVRGLLNACNELMAEAGNRRAADWAVVNDAMVAGERALRPTPTKAKA